MDFIAKLKRKVAGILLAEKTANPAKIFCISFQRTGTTSVGKFFIHQGYPVATWAVSLNNGWSKSWFDGNYEKIFSSPDFKNHIVFEDVPWGGLDFYKVLFHRFPDSKFILFTRDSDKWFDSMKSHSGGRTLGNTYIHSRIYNRETEFDNKFGDRYSYSEDVLDKLLELNESHREHYKKIYRARNKDVLRFFNSHDNSRIIHCELEDENKWKKMGAFFHIEIPEKYEVHENASNQK
ncbi:MAG: sulfotransferase [Bacteroidota bacterium]